MRSIQSWLDEYSDSHQNYFNRLVHWICVPSIMLSLLGLLWAIGPLAFSQNVYPLLNWAVVLVLAALVFYFFLSVRLALGMIIVAGMMLYLIYLLDGLRTPLWIISLILFVIAWIGQFIGHLVEGRKPSFFKDLQFLLIGPLWLLSKVYRKLGIHI